MMILNVNGTPYTVSDPMPDPSQRVIAREGKAVGYIVRKAEQHHLMDANHRPLHRFVPRADGDAGVQRLVEELHRLASDTA